MKSVALRMFALTFFFFCQLEAIVWAEGTKSDEQTTSVVQVRLTLDQPAAMNQDGWFIVSAETIKLRADSNGELKLVQFYVIKVKSGETPRRIYDDADASDGFAAEFKTQEAAIWHFWADAYTVKNERLVSNTLRVITETPARTQIQKSRPKKRSQ